MDRDAALARLREIDAEVARLHAEQDRLLVEVAGSSPIVDELWVSDRGSERERRIRITDAAREEIAAYLRWSPSYAQSRIDEGRLLAGPLARTGADLADGLISPRQVAAIVEAARRLPGRLPAAKDGSAEAALEFTAACARLQDRVLPVARRACLSRTRAAARRAVLAIDPTGHDRRKREARCTRDVYVVEDVDGLSLLIARLGTAQAHSALAAVTSAADAPADADGGSDTRTAGERRAEALVALLLRSAGGDGPAAVTAQIEVTVPLTTLLGLGSEPATLGGRHALTGDEVRDLLGDPNLVAVLHRLVTDPLDGAPLDYGRRTYQVPARLRRVIETRDRTCRFPGCARPARRCQLDHATSWEDGGCTDLDNLGPLCVRHHQLVTHGGWTIVVSRRDGSCRWRSPRGYVYDHPPPD